MGLGVVAALAALGLGVVERSNSRRVNSDRPPFEYIVFFSSRMLVNWGLSGFLCERFCDEILPEELEVEMRGEGRWGRSLEERELLF